MPEKASRRRFEASYKLQILDEADRCTEPGQLGELLRREGLYSSHLTTWQKQRDEGALSGLREKKRGRKPKTRDAKDQELARPRREKQELEEQPIASKPCRRRDLGICRACPASKSRQPADTKWPV